MTGLDPRAILSAIPPLADARLAYGNAPSQIGDLRLPDKGHPSPPLAILLHGGYWRVRYDLTYLGHLAHALTAIGFATWNLEYRRVGEAGGGYPGTFADVRAGVEFGRALADRYPIDRSRTVIIGHSAGGQLALWVAGEREESATNQRVEAVPTTPVVPWQASSLRRVGVLALAPVADLTVAWDRQLSNTAVAELLGGSPMAFAARYDATCPMRRDPLRVAHTIVHGTDDTDVPLDLSQAYFDRATRMGKTATLHICEGAEHFALIDPRSAAWPTVRDAALTLAQPGTKDEGLS